MYTSFYTSTIFLFIDFFKNICAQPYNRPKPCRVFSCPITSKILPVTPQPTAIPAFWPEPVPANWVLSPKISKISPHFSLNFDYFLGQNCIRKLYFMLKTPKFALILRWGHSWSQRIIFPTAPPHLTPFPTGTENRPRKQASPPSKFCEKTLLCINSVALDFLCFQVSLTNPSAPILPLPVTLKMSSTSQWSKSTG